MQTISRDAVKAKLDKSNVHVVDLLTAKEFKDFHIPGAINIPFKQDDFEKQLLAKIPNKNDEVIVYCNDKSSIMVVEAASKIETLGYKKVFEYAEGKQDWKMAGLPIQ